MENVSEIEVNGVKAFNDKIKSLKNERFEANKEIIENKKMIENAEALIRDLSRRNEV